MTRQEAIDREKAVENGAVFWDKNAPGDLTSWKYDGTESMVFRFDDDPEKEYYLYRDYSTLTADRKEIFDRENPFWADWFKGAV